MSGTRNEPEERDERTERITRNGKQDERVKSRAGRVIAANLPTCLLATILSIVLYSLCFLSMGCCFHHGQS